MANSAFAINAIDATASGTLSSPGQVAVSAVGRATVTVHVSGTSTGSSYKFQGSVDGSNWSDIGAYTPASVLCIPGVGQSGTGDYIVPCGGWSQVRVNLTAISTGSLTFALNAGMGVQALIPHQSVNIDQWNGLAPSLPQTLGATGLSGMIGPMVGAAGYVWNGSSLDPVAPTLSGTLLASSARTTTTASAWQTNYTARGVYVWLNVSAASGTGGLSVYLEGLDPVSGNFTVVYVPTASAITATTLAGFAYYPGISGGTVVSNQGTYQVAQAALPRTWRIRVVHGDGSSYTYSVGYSLIP